MGCHLLITVACLFASWAVLSLLGGERQRRLDAIELQRRAAEATAAQERALAALKERQVPIAPAANQSAR
jgi:hypothetical protein